MAEFNRNISIFQQYPITITLLHDKHGWCLLIRGKCLEGIDTRTGNNRDVFTFNLWNTQSNHTDNVPSSCIYEVYQHSVEIFSEESVIGQSKDFSLQEWWERSYVRIMTCIQTEQKKDHKRIH